MDRILLMRLFSLLLLSGWGCLAQLPVIPLQASSAPASLTNCTLLDPSGSNSLYERWISTTLPASLPVSGTNIWYGCVANLTWAITNVASTSFTNNALGLKGTGISPGGSSLTNLSLAPGTNSTVTIILYPFRFDSPAVDNVISPYAMNDSAQSGHPAGLVANNSAWSWSYPFVGGAALSSTVAVSNWYDVTIVQSNTVVICYTNGILSKAITGYTPPAGGWPWKYLGFSAGNSGGHTGFLPEVLMWSNVLSATAILVGVHNYATNAYHYTP